MLGPCLEDPRTLGSAIVVVGRWRETLVSLVFFSSNVLVRIVYSDTYIKATSGEDQFTGRACALLPITSVEFGSLPPHLDPRELPDATFWSVVAPGYKRLPNSFHPVLPFLLASIIHHQKFLSETLSPQHPLFKSNLWLSGLLEGKAVHGGTINNSTSLLQATGIPPLVIMQQNMVEIASELKDVKNSLSSGFTSAKNEISQMLNTGFADLPVSCVNEILTRIRVEGSSFRVVIMLFYQVFCFRCIWSDICRC